MAFDPRSIIEFSIGSECYPSGQVYLLNESTWPVEDAVLDDDGQWTGEYDFPQVVGNLREVLEILDYQIWMNRITHGTNFVSL